MLKIKSDSVEAIISEVADTLIVPRFKQLPPCDIHYKSFNNPVTIADLEAKLS